MSIGASLLIVLGIRLMTYSMRAVVIVALASRPIPASLGLALKNVGPAVLAALAVNLAAGGEGGPSLEVAEGAALVVAGFASWRWRNLMVTLSSGMCVLWLLSAVL